MTTETAYYLSPLGTLKLQSTDGFVSAVLFSEEDAEPSSALNPVLSACINQLVEFFAGSRKAFDLPLKQDGTAFQQKIWELLYQIPYGKTVSYNELSKQYGDVKAIRAVASANGKNNLAIIIPCHRVIGSNQSLTGYAGGLWRKKWLLEHEAKHHNGVQLLNF